MQHPFDEPTAFSRPSNPERQFGEYKGERLALAEFASRFGADAGTVRERIRLGWTPDEASMPANGPRKTIKTIRALTAPTSTLGAKS
jgi:hypothetical protein